MLYIILAVPDSLGLHGIVMDLVVLISSAFGVHIRNMSLPNAHYVIIQNFESTGLF
jgi:hypothetical protein